MKNFNLLVIGMSAMLLFACGDSSDTDATIDSVENSDKEKTKKDALEAIDDINDQDRILGVKSGKMTFTYSGKYSGTETVWFDGYGKRVVMEQRIQVSKKMFQNKRLVWPGQKEGSLICQYTDDFGNEIDQACNEMFIRAKDTELSLFAHGDEAQLKYGYESIGTKKILGKEAAGWKSNSGEITAWIWKGIDVKYNNLGIEKEMTSFESIDQIPSEMLGLPDGFTLDE